MKGYDEFFINRSVNTINDLASTVNWRLQTNLDRCTLTKLTTSHSVFFDTERLIKENCLQNSYGLEKG